MGVAVATAGIVGTACRRGSIHLSGDMDADEAGAVLELECIFKDTHQPGVFFVDRHVETPGDFVDLVLDDELI